MPDPINRYCDRLGIPVPRVEDAMGRSEVTLTQLAVVALLEHGGPMSVAEIAARLDRAGLPARLARPDLAAALRKGWRGQPPLVRDGPDRFALNFLSRELRYAQIVTGIDLGIWRPDSGRPKPSEAEWEERRARRQAAEVAHARATRRALVHAVPPGLPSRGAALVDLTSGRVEVYLGDHLSGLHARLDDYDFLAGVDLRPVLRAFGLDSDRWLLAELRPAQRTFRPSDGASLPVTLPAAVKATTGVAGVPADADTWEPLLDPKRPNRAATRLTQEARVMSRFFEYGAVHGGVRLRSRAGDALLPVSWSMRGDPDVHSIFEAAARALAPVEVVIGPPGAAEDPWMHARRADVLDLVGLDVVLGVDDEIRALTTHDLWSVRIPDPDVARTVGPRYSMPEFRGACRLTVTLDGIDPPIWRRINVPIWYRLSQVHDILQIALGWTNSHLHMFTFGDERLGTPYELGDFDDSYTRSDRLLRLGDVIALGHRRIGYDYDFGDGWRHTVTLDPLPDAERETPLACVDGARAVPPEDCGGIGGYEELLEVLFNPSHEDFERLREWVGPGFEPERFTLREVNWRLRDWQRTGQIV